MSKIEVEGMHRLQGEVNVQGSKNAVLPILSACVLIEGEVILHECPRIQDVFSMLEVLEHAGARYSWEGTTLILNTSEMYPAELIENAGTMRSSVMLLGSFLARFRKVTLGYPGGCCIGKRPIDLHEQTLEALGAVFCEEEDHLEAWTERLDGCEIFLPYPSVGVTENLLLAASAASGMTGIFGAAREPEIVELCRFLCAAGIRIQGIGTDHVCVYPGKIRKHVEYTICKDRIVAGTYLLAVTAIGGEAIIKDAPLEHMRSTIQLVGRSGALLRRDRNDIQVIMNQKPKAISNLRTAPYPGFPTDLQSPFLAAMLKAFGRSAIEESMFENRFLIVEELRKMGANISISGQTAHISPVKKLQGCDLEVRELRGGAALVIAALNAEGSSVLHHTEIIFRGYENIVRDFQCLNAKIYDVESVEQAESRKS